MRDCLRLLVRCSLADNCIHLQQRRCPLTVGYGEALNALKIRVLKGERGLVIAEDNRSVREVGEPRPDGTVIYFGTTTVIGREES